MPHRLVEVNRPRVIPVAQTPQAVAEPPHILLRQAAPPAAQQDKAEKGCRRLGRYDVRFVRMQRQPPPCETRGNALAPLDEDSGVVVKQGEVVDIAQIGRAKDFFRKMIETVEIDVSEKLARQIADRQPAAAGQRRQQIVAGIVEVDRLLRIGAVNHRVEQPQGARAGDAPAQILLQDLVIDRREIAIDIAAQHMPMAIAIALIAGDRLVRPFACAVGIGIENKAALEDRLDDGAERMMDDAVAERCC